jgi:hypothetical protein
MRYNDSSKQGGIKGHMPCYDSRRDFLALAGRRAVQTVRRHMGIMREVLREEEVWAAEDGGSRAEGAGLTLSGDAAADAAVGAVILQMEQDQADELALFDRRQRVFYMTLRPADVQSAAGLLAGQRAKTARRVWHRRCRVHVD